MSAHSHRTHVPGCYRCDLSSDEAFTMLVDASPALTDAFAAIDRGIDAVWMMSVEWRTPDDKATADEEALESVKALLSSQSAELDRLRSTLAWLIEHECVMWTKHGAYIHDYGSIAIPAPADVIATLEAIDLEATS